MTTTDFRTIGRRFALEAVSNSYSFESMRDAIAAYYDKLADHLSAYGRFDTDANQAYKGFHAVVATLETAI